MLLVGQMWTMGLWIRKAAECFKQSLMEHISRSKEDSAVLSNVDYHSPAQMFQRRRILISGPEIVLMIFW